LLATDLYYASVDGDMFPDMYYGRIPAQDATQLNAMLAKTMTYEKYEFANDDYLNNVTLIAGADPTWNPRVGQPTLNYGTTNYFNAARGFNNVNAYLTTYTGCYSNDKVAASLVNYTAHCSQTSWSTPYLGTATAKTFGNAGEYTLAIGNCCQSGDFSISECMGEAWIRNPNAGAVAYLGSVPDTYWWEDFYWSVGAHAPVYNQYPDSSASSLGIFDALFSTEYHSVDAMVFVGNLAVTEAHNEGYDSDINSQYYWEAYHCLGDPSLIPYLTKGLNNIVSHDSTFQFGITEYTVKALPGSTVALSNANGLIGTAITGTDSMAIISTDTLTLADSVTLVVTKPKYKPYFYTLPIGVVARAYLAVENIEIIDGNLNGKLEYSENANIEITLKNIGNQTAENIWVSISSTDSYLENFSQNAKIPTSNILADQTRLIVSNFNFSVKDSVPDQHNVKFNVTLSDSISGNPRTLYSSIFYSKLNAPQFEILTLQLMNDFTGNGNLVIDYGETATLQLSAVNKGNAIIETDALLSNISLNGALQLNTTSVSLGAIGLNDTVLINFEVQLPFNAELKTADSLLLKVVGGQYIAEKVFNITLGNSLFAEIGNGNAISSQYPLNNYYKSNTTQILYLRSEMDNGVKAIKSIAFNLAAATSNLAYRDLNNFKIKAVLSNILEITSKVDMTNAQMLYSNAMYYLPDAPGWAKFDFQQAIILPDNKNIVFEVSWGKTDNYAPENNTTTVYSTATNFKSVVWGISDDVSPAPINESSYIRPNAQFEFDSVGILNITVEVDLPVKNSILLDNFNVTINSESKLTDNLGRTQFYFLEYSGSYNVNFSRYGYYDSTISVNKTNTYEHIQIQLNRHPELAINVKNTDNEPIENAEINIGGFTYYTNTNGKILSYATPHNQQAIYSINKTGYFVLTDSVLVDSVTKSISLTLKDDYDLKLFISNMENALDGVKATLNNEIKYCNAQGMVSFNDIIEGVNSIKLEKKGYLDKTITFLFSNIDTIIYCELVQIPDLKFTVLNQGEPVDNAKITINKLIYFTDANGEVLIVDLLPHEYVFTVEKLGLLTHTDTLVINEEDYLETIEMEQAEFSIVFTITDSLAPLENAQIVLNKIEKLSDVNGKIEYNNLIAGESYSFAVIKDGYFGYFDTIALVDKHLDIDIALQLIKYRVQFNITDGNGVIDGVNINFDNKDNITDLEGVAVFSEIVPSTEIPYYLRKSDTHYSDSGFISLSGDTIINIELLLLPVVSKIGDKIPSLNIYPNPTQGQFYIAANKSLVGTNFTIIDNYGKVVLKGKITEVPQIIKLEGSKGVYHISLTVGDKLIRNSIILQ
jgi:hypothetical protein